MRKLSIIAAIAVLIFASGSVASAENKTNGEKKDVIHAPALSGSDVTSRKKVDLASYKGKVVLINFWATWCPPCRAEIPDLVKLSEQNTQNLEIIGVSLDDTVDPVKPFLAQNKVTYPVIMGNQEIAETWGGISAIPTSFVIGRDGNVVGKIVGMRDQKGFLDVLKPLF
jgi:thiol-disulfide isomerase/thioredoxin